MTWEDETQRHAMAKRRIESAKSFFTQVFGYMPGWMKPENRKDFPNQKRFLSPKTVAERKNKTYRRATLSGELAQKGDKVRFVPGDKTDQVGYSPMGFKIKKDDVGPPKFYRDYMYVGDGKAIKDEDDVPGVTSMSELRKSLSVLKADYDSNRITKNQFRYRHYLMHMALLAMKDKPHNGEFADQEKRDEAQNLIKSSLASHGLNVKGWSNKSDYYRSARELSDSTNCNHKTHVCADEVKFFDDDGNPTKRKTEHYTIIDSAGLGVKSNLTVGDRMKNKKTSWWLEQVKKAKRMEQSKPLKGKSLGGSRVSLTMTAPNVQGQLRQTLEKSPNPKSEAQVIMNTALLTGANRQDDYAKRVFAQLATATKESSLPMEQKMAILGAIKDKSSTHGWEVSEILK